MPHVDEGMLHAYLDGALDALLEAGALPQGTTRDSVDAHLAVCADCRALLEAERTIRTRAGAVLDAAAPVIEVPPFSELFADSRTRPRRRRVWPLAWAASVLLAVGAGWWGSELYRSQAFVTRSAELSELAPQADRALDDAATRAGSAGGAQPIAAPPAPVDVPRADAAAPSFRDAAGNAGAATGERRESTRGAVADMTIAPTLPAPPQAQQARPTETEAARLERSGDTRRAAVADTGRPLGRITSTAADTGAAGRERVAAAPPPSAAPPPPRAEQQRAARNLMEAAVPREPAAQADVADFQRMLADLDAGRVPLAADDVPADLPLLQIDGGSTPAVQRGMAIGATLARITQRAPTGVAVEVIVWKQAALALDALVITGAAGADSAAQRALRQRAEADRAQRARAGAEVAQKQRAAAAAPLAHTVLGSRSLPDGRRELLLRPIDGAVLVALRAPVSAAELQALAGRLVEIRRD